MTATEARRLTDTAAAKKAAELEPKVQLLVDLWLELIQNTATDGGSSCRECQLDRPRTKLPSAAKAEALRRLVAMGYSVSTGDDDVYRGSSQVTVSW